MMNSEASATREDVVLVIPGLADRLTRPDGDLHLFPSTTVTFVKAMRDIGIPIELAVAREDATFVSHNAAEVWLPFLDIGIGVIAGAGGNLLASMVERAFKRSEHSTMAHIDWKVTDKKGRTHRFKFDGRPADAVKAVRAFERALDK